MIYGPGSISNFQAGISSGGANGLNISSLILENNDIGYSLTNSSGTDIHQNIIQGNNLGIGSNSSIRVNVTSNLFNGNLLTGVTFLNTTHSNIAMNNIVGSQNGVFLDAQSSENTIVANNVLENIIDIKDSDDNKFADNSCQISEPGNIC